MGDFRKQPEKSFLDSSTSIGRTVPMNCSFLRPEFALRKQQAASPEAVPSSAVFQTTRLKQQLFNWCQAISFVAFKNYLDAGTNSLECPSLVLLQSQDSPLRGCIFCAMRFSHLDSYQKDSP